MLTEQEYKSARALVSNMDKWVDSKRGRNGWASYGPSEVPPEFATVDNTLRSSVEVYEFVHNPPARYFLYVKGAIATTWTGEELGVVTYGREYRDNFGGKRVPVTIRAINGRKYHGTFYKSAGDYARIRLAKR